MKLCVCDRKSCMTAKSDYMFDTNFHDKEEYYHHDRFRERIEMAAKYLDKQLKMGKPVLVFCQAGINRSAALVVYYAITRKGMTYQEAVSYVRGRNMDVRGVNALTNRAFKRNLRLVSYQFRFRSPESYVPIQDGFDP
tara:strand:- start:2107 stop:2520 length:414 start_codon:yes stop_codon:yes gene_type:complete